MNLDNATELLGVLSFGAAALFCFKTWQRAGGPWGGLAVIYGALAVEVLSGTRHLLSDLLRETLRSSAFYAQRAELPVVLLISGLLLGLFTVALGWLAWTERARGPVRLALICGLFTVFLFVLEIVSLHQVDTRLYRPTGPALFIGWLWMGLAGVTGLAALRAHRTSAD